MLKYLPAFIVAAGSLTAAALHRTPEDPESGIPSPPREFRGVWVATVANIDWPSKPGLSTAEQKREMLAILDRAAYLHLNAVVFQVRPACDALYRSELEPWSEYLTGRQGQAPDPPYDPLAFAVHEAHLRGLELHAWFNPYRAKHADAKSPLASSHIRFTHPNLVKQYGHSLWLDPGEKAVQDHTIHVILDVVKRYDIDGVHIDDYFYPYKEKDSSGKLIDFPDEPSWQRYLRSGGTLSREDWRRENVNTLIQRLYHGIKAEKKWVKFGISPFGIWRPGNPEPIKGFDQYAELYADARKWLQEGWLDYCSPQLYWRIGQPAQSYPVLLKWWAEQNTCGRNIWPGNYTGRCGEPSWPADEILNQVKATRDQAGATGNVHFSMKSLMAGHGGVGEALRQGPYAQQALVPASRWLDEGTPSRPILTVRREGDAGALRASWRTKTADGSWLWVLAVKRGDWQIRILPGGETRIPQVEGRPETIAVAAVDRCGNQGPYAVWRAEQ